MASYRQVGGKLAAFIRTRNPSSQQIQGLLSDLIFEDSILVAVRDLVTRRSFVSIKHLAGSGSGEVERDSVLAELSETYLPSVINELTELLNGYLDLNSRISATSLVYESSQETTTPIQPSTVPSTISTSASDASGSARSSANRSSKPIIRKASSAESIERNSIGEDYPIFYCSPPLRIFCLSIITGGFYDFLWFYRFWRGLRRYEEQTGLSSSVTGNNLPLTAVAPFMAALFSPIFIVGTSRRIQARLARNGIETRVHIWGTFCLFWIPAVFAGVFSGLGSFSVLLFVISNTISSYQLLRLQRQSNVVVRSEVGHLTMRDSSIRLADIIFTLIGLLVFSGNIINIYTPAP